ncbi:MAG: hypothetical protein HOV68_09980 [Streptomycetaceae bacterium]|nr:hypothetical protein [Streptomycetaceae bacterium]
MNTHTAATEAHVTTATIRLWCRTGSVTAIKISGRWVIDANSLTHRIAIGRMRAPRTIHYLCRHTLRARGQGPTRIPYVCTPCQRAQHQRAQARADRGPLATRPHVNYLASLIRTAVVLPAGCPTSRDDLEHLPRATASALIDQLKAAPRPRRTACGCASSRYSSICTC